MEIDPEVFFCRSANTPYYRYHNPEADKTKIKDALKAGEVIDGATLVTNTSMTIK